MCFTKECMGALAGVFCCCFLARQSAKNLEEAGEKVRQDKERKEAMKEQLRLQKRAEKKAKKKRRRRKRREEDEAYTDQRPSQTPIIVQLGMNPAQYSGQVVQGPQGHYIVQNAGPQMLDQQRLASSSVSMPGITPSTSTSAPRESQQMSEKSKPARRFSKTRSRSRKARVGKGGNPDANTDSVEGAMDVLGIKSTDEHQIARTQSLRSPDPAERSRSRSSKKKDRRSKTPRPSRKQKK